MGPIMEDWNYEDLEHHMRVVCEYHGRTGLRPVKTRRWDYSTQGVRHTKRCRTSCVPGQIKPMIDGRSPGQARSRSGISVGSFGISVRGPRELAMLVEWRST